MNLSQANTNIFREVKHVSIDFDGVLMSYLFNGTGDFPSYDFSVTYKPFVLLRALLQKSSALLDNLFRKPVPGAKECILQFKAKGIKVSLLTSRGRAMESLTKSWLKSQGLYELFDNFFFAEINERGPGHKLDIVGLEGIDLHIDDRAHAIESLSKDYSDRKFIYFNCHKVAIPDLPNVYTVDSWKEIENLL